MDRVAVWKMVVLVAVHKSKKQMKQTIFIALFWVFLSSCHTTAKTNQLTLKQIPSALLGHFTDDYGSSYAITGKIWMHGTKAKYHLLKYNKAENYFIAKNDEANPSDAGLYSRVDIMFFKNMEPWYWGYCLTAYKANTIQEAINTAPADRTNPRKGCNGYPFSRMKRK